MLKKFWWIGLKRMNDCLKLSKEVYVKDIIEQVIKDYSEICVVHLNEDERYFNCVFFDTVMDKKITMKEFEDYLIGLTRKYEY